jgi:gas vesicle protein
MSVRSFFWGVLAGLAAGLWLASRKGPQARREAEVTYFEVKGRVLEDMKKLKRITKKAYENAVDSAVGGYEEARLLTAQEAGRIRDELKSGHGWVKDALAPSAGNRRSV